MTSTLWGYAQHQKTLAPGIVEYSTAGHGGIGLSAERQAQLPAWYDKDWNWNKSNQWFEEDCDWAMAYLIFLNDIIEAGKVEYKDILKAKDNAYRVLSYHHQDFLTALSDYSFGKFLEREKELAELEKSLNCLQERQTS